MAFGINGGAGRVLCSIPALEKYEAENPEDDFIVVADFFHEIFAGHPTLYKRCFSSNHKNIFQDKIKDRNYYSPEPYQLWEYYNQKASIAQAFDILINKKGIRQIPYPNLCLSKVELLSGMETVKDIKKHHKKEKLVVFQPFGRGTDPNFTGSVVNLDNTGKSFSIEAAAKVIKKIESRCVVLLMNNSPVDFGKYNCKNEVIYLRNSNLRQWFSIINSCDVFVGCDSVGQHAANAYNKKSVVVLGSTFKENVSYPENQNFKILDYDQNKMYCPIRVCGDDVADRHNERLMNLRESHIEEIAENIIKKL